MKRSKLLILTIIFTLIISMIMVGCNRSTSKKDKTDNQEASESTTSSSSTEPVKIRVEVFDRSNAPEGQGTATDNKWTKKIQEEALKEGLEVEFVACPRAEEIEKLNIWMASQEPPDIVFTYNFDTVYSFADQGGIYDLTEFINKPDSKIKELYESSLSWGIYKGKQYAIPSLTCDWGGATALYVRQDWLDKLNIAHPTTPEELYEMLKAFKEKDPGGVGANNVVPFALPAPGVTGTQGFFLDFLVMFGVEFDGPYLACMPTGNYENGKFMSPVDNPYAKESYRFLNKLYNEKLIHPEFVTDTNGAKYDQHVFTGLAGLVNVNPQTPGAPKTLNVETQKAVADANWVPIKPIANPKGEIMTQGPRKGGLLMMVPSSSKVPEAALKYLEWMIESGMDKLLRHGEEGVHHEIIDGVIMPIDTEFNAKDIHWVAGDLAITTDGNRWIKAESLSKIYPTEDGEHFANVMIWSQQYGRPYEVITEPRPNTLKNSATLQKYMFQGAAKVIVAKDFESEYEAYINGWNKLGGDEYDAEITAALKAMGK